MTAQEFNIKYEFQWIYYKFINFPYSNVLVFVLSYYFSLLLFRSQFFNQRQKRGRYSWQESGDDLERVVEGKTIQGVLDEKNIFFKEIN